MVVVQRAPAALLIASKKISDETANRLARSRTTLRKRATQHRKKSMDIPTDSVPLLGKIAHRIVPLSGTIVLGLLSSSAALAQDAAVSLTRGPRFMLAVPGSAAPTRIDVRSTPTLRGRVALHLRNATVEEALKAVSAQTNIHFVYSPDLVPADRKITLKAEEITVAAALTQILLGTDVDVVLGKSGQVALMARRSPARGEISGRVIDAMTQRGIASSRVEVVGSAISTETDSTGAFRLASVPPGVVSLRATAVSYLPLIQTDVVVGATRPATVVLALSSAPLEMTELTVRPGYFPSPRETPTSTQRLNPEEIRRSPGAQEDVVRAVSHLPGVAPTAIHDNTLVVRGGAPFENLFVVDGLEVPNINHFSTQGSSGGFVSLINLDLVQEAEFSAGGFGASNGDRVGSVTDLTLREGSTDRHLREVNLSATGFGAIVEGPVGRGSYVAALRRSYLDLILELSGESWVTHYWDANAKLVQRLGNHDALAWMFVGARDRWGFNIEDADDRYDASIMAVNVDQYFSALTWSHSTDRSFLELTAGRVFRSFDTFQNDTLGITQFTNQSTEPENSLAIRYSHSLPNGATLELGTVAKYSDDLHYDVELPGFLRPDGDGEPRPLDVDTAFSAFRLGSYGEATVQWTPRFSTTLGGRIDYYGHLGDAVRLAPRIAASLELTDAITLNASGGRYWQTPSFIWLVGDAANADNLRPLRVDQGVIGVQALPREDVKLQIEAYYKRYGSYPTRVWRPQAVLTPGIEHVRADVPFGLEPLTSEGTGSAYGAELFVQKRLSAVPVYGLASLSLNRTRFTALDGVSRVGAYDTPVAATLALGWRPNASWDLGVRFRIASGRPLTPYIESGPFEGRIDFDRYLQGGRMPAYHTLDIRIDRRWTLGSMQLTTYLDIQDVYNRNNPIAYTWDERLHAPHYEEAIGFLPSIGVNIEF